MVKKRQAATLFLVLTATFAALTFVVTFVLPVPFPVGNGYVNFGDAVIFISAFLLGPLGGAAAGAIGSSIADIMLGYATYAPFTFVVKGLEGLLAGVFYAYVLKKFSSFPRRLLSMLVAGAWVTVGYFLTDLLLTGNAAVAAMNNFVYGLAQPILSAVIALIVLPRVPDLFRKYSSINTENAHMGSENDAPADKNDGSDGDNDNSKQA